MWAHWLGSLRYVGTLAGVTEVCGYIGSLRYVGTLNWLGGFLEQPYRSLYHTSGSGDHPACDTLPIPAG